MMKSAIALLLALFSVACGKPSGESSGTPPTAPTAPTRAAYAMHRIESALR